MRQVTGRSSNNSTTKASIRLTSGGRFFSASMVSSLAGNGDITVVVDTASVTLVPADIATILPPEQILTLCGHKVKDEEQALVCKGENGIVAVLSMDVKAYQLLEQHLGSRLHITTPLLSTSHNQENCLVAEVANDCCYLRLYNNGLQCAEAITVGSDDEILFYISNLLNLQSVSQSIPIYIIGSKSAAKLLKKYYKVICE